MDDLLAFLRARLDEDEQAIANTWDPPSFLPSHQLATMQQSVVMARPERIRREVQVKRQILDEHDNVNDGSCGTCVDGSWGYPTHGGSTPQRYPCRTLRLLATVYADHPRYRPEWALLES